VRRRTLDDQVGPEHTHGRDTDTSLSGTVGSTEAGEDDGGSATHRSEERLLWLVSKFLLPCVCILRPAPVASSRLRRGDSQRWCFADGFAIAVPRSYETEAAMLERLESCTYGIHGAGET
jgi:hypothetical protein